MIELVREGVIPNTHNRKYIIDTAGELTQLEADFGNEAYCIADKTTYICNGSGEFVRKKDPSDDFAKIDGYYEGMSVGNSEQLIASQGAVNAAPYLFRNTGGAVDVGTLKNMKIVGGSVVWNQQMENGDFASDDGWSSSASELALSVTDNKAILNVVSSISYNVRLDKSMTRTPVSGHVYLASAEITSSNFTKVRFIVGGVSSSLTGINANIKESVQKVVVSGSSGNAFSIQPNRESDLPTGATVVVENVQLFDLTLMFGSTVADKIKTMETATAGSGIAWIKSYGFFGKDYYPYEAGVLYFTKPISLIDTGFNLFNNPTGKAKLVGGRAVQITGAYTALSYVGTDGNTETITPDADGIFTPTNTGVLTVTGGNSETCVHFVWNGSRNGETEEYKSVSIPIVGKGYISYYQKRAYESGDESLTDAITDGVNTVVKRSSPTYGTYTASKELYGIPKLDTDGNLYYDGDIVDLGENLWCDDFGTEEIVDTRAIPMPTGTDSFYQSNLRDKVQHLPSLPNSLADSDYIVHVSGTQMILEPYVPYDASPLTVNLTLNDGSTQFYTADCTLGDILDATDEGRQVWVSYQLSGDTNTFNTILSVIQESDFDTHLLQTEKTDVSTGNNIVLCCSGDLDETEWVVIIYAYTHS